MTLNPAFPPLVPAEKAPEAGASYGVPLTASTVRRWCRSHPELAVKVGGRAYLRRDAFAELVSGGGRVEPRAA